MQHMGDTIEAFLSLTERLATVPEVERMLQQVLEQLTQATQSQAAAVYLWDAGRQHAARRRSRQPGHTAAGTLAYPPLPAAPRGAGRREPAGPGTARPPGRSAGLLVLELGRRRARRCGLPALRTALGHAGGGHRDPPAAGIAPPFDAIIQLIADAIDAKSAYTGGHCERVPQMAIEFADHLHAAADGPYADFQMSENERYAFRLGAWLHDCGKVTSPHIVDKATKLEAIRNRIHEVRLRFEILWRDAELAAARGELDAAQLAARQQQLIDDFAFVATCNVGGEFLSDDAIARLQAIGAQGWQRHFDDRLGLSDAELRSSCSCGPKPRRCPPPKPCWPTCPNTAFPGARTAPPWRRATRATNTAST
jgi:hypothetical protein